MEKKLIIAEYLVKKALLMERDSRCYVSGLVSENVTHEEYVRVSNLVMESQHDYIANLESILEELAKVLELDLEDGCEDHD